ncbi:MAG: hypothetical protein U0X93_17465 [Anaerolineales bacterium]
MPACLSEYYGSPTVEKNAGFKKAMATFDATRPLVAATGVGKRAALEFLKEKLAESESKSVMGCCARS